MRVVFMILYLRSIYLWKIITDGLLLGSSVSLSTKPRLIADRQHCDIAEITSNIRLFITDQSELIAG